MLSSVALFNWSQQLLLTVYWLVFPTHHMISAGLSFVRGSWLFDQILILQFKEETGEMLGWQCMCCHMLYYVLMTECLSIYSRAALPPLVTCVTVHEQAFTHLGWLLRHRYGNHYLIWFSSSVSKTYSIYLCNFHIAYIYLCNFHIAYIYLFNFHIYNYLICDYWFLTFHRQFPCSLCESYTVSLHHTLCCDTMTWMRWWSVKHWRLALARLPRPFAFHFSFLLRKFFTHFNLVFVSLILKFQWIFSLAFCSFFTAEIKRTCQQKLWIYCSIYCQWLGCHYLFYFGFSLVCVIVLN